MRENSNVKKIFSKGIADGTKMKICGFQKYRIFTGWEKYEMLLEVRGNERPSFWGYKVDPGIPEKKTKSHLSIRISFSYSYINYVFTSEFQVLFYSVWIII